MRLLPVGKSSPRSIYLEMQIMMRCLAVRRTAALLTHRPAKNGMETGMKRLIAIAALMALPLPALAQANAALIEKGRALFNDTGLSAGGQYSCATCHPMNGHTDN